MRILDLEGGAEEVYAEHEVDTEPADETLYDVILAGRTLELVNFTEFGARLKELAELLAEAGQLHLYVPSLDWPMREVLGGRVTPAVYLHLWGDDEHRIRCAFRLIDLREMFWSAGMATARAETRVYDIARTGGGDLLKGELHYIVGFKGDWQDAPDFWLKSERAPDPGA